MKMINEMQKYVVSQRRNLEAIFVIIEKIEKQKNETFQKLKKAKTMIHFLQNDLAKQQQNQSLTDQFIQSMKIHSSVVSSVFIVLDASKVVKSVKLSDEKALTNNDENEFENWLNEVKNKLQNNVDWYSIETNKIDYVRFQLAIDDDAVKHVRARLKSDSDKSFKTVEEVLQMLIRMYEDSNKKKRCSENFQTWSK